MAVWKITNLHKKNAVERQFWTKDGITVTKDEGFRWGTWTCDSDERPDIDLTNPVFRVIVSPPIAFHAFVPIFVP